MKPVVTVAIAVAVIAVLFFLFFQGKELEAPIAPATASVGPTIDVIEGVVTVMKDGSERPVSSGETIEAPFSLTSAEDGRAIVKMADGSELRLDRASTLVVSVASYDAHTNDLMVSAKLSVGKVWSSILALATPGSSWEVETSNVVGTVRGTAFGMEVFENGDTKVTGSEHRITLTIIDPDTNTRDEERTMNLNEDEFVVIGNSLAREKGTPLPKAEKRTDKETEDPWVKENEGRDRDTRGEGRALEEMADEIKDDAAELIPQPDRTVRNESLPVPVPRPATNTERPTPVSLSLQPGGPLSGIVEGTPVSISARVRYSDGTTRDISREASWKVLGDIGSMQGNTFNPLLAPNVSELGRALGSVSASWKDAESGKEFQGATPIFEVKAKIVPLGTEEG